jgi:hypothetical protein
MGNRSGGRKLDGQQIREQEIIWATGRVEGKKIRWATDQKQEIKEQAVRGQKIK